MTFFFSSKSKALNTCKSIRLLKPRKILFSIYFKLLKLKSRTCKLTRFRKESLIFQKNPYFPVLPNNPDSPYCYIENK